jgi:hypothetical protein
MYASASASCICETAQRRLVGSSHRQGYIASAQACEGGSVAEGGQKVFERGSRISQPVSQGAPPTSGIRRWEGR